MSPKQKCPFRWVVETQYIHHTAPAASNNCHRRTSTFSSFKSKYIGTVYFFFGGFSGVLGFVTAMSVLIRLQLASPGNPYFPDG